MDGARLCDKQEVSRGGIAQHDSPGRCEPRKHAALERPGVTLRGFHAGVTKGSAPVRFSTHLFLAFRLRYEPPICVLVS